LFFLATFALLEQKQEFETPSRLLKKALAVDALG
jgi:hypothetical protein